MAPSLQDQLIGFQVDLMNFSRSLISIDSIEKLIKARDYYLEWLEAVLDFSNTNSLALSVDSPFLEPDRVRNHLMNGGVGVDIAEEPAQSLLGCLKEEIRDRFNQLARMAESLNSKLVITKCGSSFHYFGRRIKMSEGSHHYLLLDYLFTCGKQGELISHQQLRTHFKKVLVRGSDVKNWVVTNALRTLLRAHLEGGGDFKNQLPDGRELIELKRGKGYVLNNSRVRDT